MPIVPFMPLLHFLLLGGVLVSNPLKFSIINRLFYSAAEVECLTLVRGFRLVDWAREPRKPEG